MVVIISLPLFFWQDPPSMIWHLFLEGSLSKSICDSLLHSGESWDSSAWPCLCFLPFRSYTWHAVQPFSLSLDTRITLEASDHISLPHILTHCFDPRVSLVPSRCLTQWLTSQDRWQYWQHTASAVEWGCSACKQLKVILCMLFGASRGSLDLSALKTLPWPWVSWELSSSLLGA